MGKHTANLRRIFPKLKKVTNFTIETSLKNLERRGKKLALDMCNRPENDEGEYGRREKTILSELDTILGFVKAKVPVFLNGDPRGYALKIDDAWVRKNNVTIARDMGGYGIICPEKWD